MSCYRCGGPHYKSSCPQSRDFPPAPGLTAGPEQWKPTDVLAFPARRDPSPPSPGYLQTRIALDMPSAGLPSPLSVICPWCGAGTWSPCTNAGTGQRTAIHQARKETRRHPPPCHWCGLEADDTECPASGNGRHEWLDDEQE